MTILLETIKQYWKVLALLFTVTTSLTGGAVYVVRASVWVGRVDTHVKQGDVKIAEFDQSQKGAARLEEKVNGIDGKLDDFRAEVRKQLERIQDQNERIEWRLRSDKKANSGSQP